MLDDLANYQGPLFFLIIALVMMAATTLQAAIGFGFNLLATPVLIVLFPEPAIIVPALVLAWYPIGLMLAWRNHKQIHFGRVMWWSLPAIPGVILGVWLLRDLDAAVIRRVIGSVTIVSAILIALNLTRPVRREKLWLLGTGSCSAVLSGSTGMSGPPVVLLGLNQRWPMATLRPTLFLYFSGLNTLTIACLLYQGMITEPSVRVAIAGIPGLLLGMVAGSMLARRIPEHLFRYFAIALLVVAGVSPWLFSS